MNNRINLTKEKEEKMVEALKKYFEMERNEELGDLASRMMLDFIVEELADEFYNQGVYDSYTFMSDRCEDLLSIEKKWFVFEQFIGPFL